MVRLKEIDLTDVESKKQRVLSIRAELAKEQEELKDMLVALNLDYYGMVPSKYFKSIDKEYVTDDGYEVKINQGKISISKRLQENLMITWIESFDMDTKFSISRSFFRYDSGRNINSFISKDKIAEKYKNEIDRFRCILEEELVYNPFSEYRDFYSFIDFYNI